MIHLTLNRKERRKDGIFGELHDDSAKLFLFTLEHAYPVGDDPDGWEPKLAAGTYTCKRGPHKLKNSHKLDDREPDFIEFETFEVMGVPPFQGKNVFGILVHRGNYNKDSDGCILVGIGQGRMDDGGKMITSSKEAFKQFLQYLDGQDEFTLTVINSY